jgi:transcriptional regulator with XRE-family HTH domain
MSGATEREQIVAGIKGSKRFRDAFRESQIKVGFPFQIRALRHERGWSQKKLGQMAGGIAQEVISRLESPGNSVLNLSTALKLASGFDVGLVLRFVPFSDLVDWAVNITPDRLYVPSIKSDKRLDEPYPKLRSVAAVENRSSSSQSGSSPAILGVRVSLDAHALRQIAESLPRALNA